jgi:hypothetical protein
MGQTTFSGPIKAGDIKDTSGTQLGVNVANIGNVVLSQTSEIKENTLPSDTTIVIPANSSIVSIDLLIDKSFSGAPGSDTASCGFNSTADNLTDQDVINGNGLTNLTPNGDLSDIRNWINVGPSDVRVRFKNNTSGVGEGYLRVRYIQAAGLLHNA